MEKVMTTGAWIMNYVCMNYERKWYNEWNVPKLALHKFGF